MKSINVSHLKVCLAILPILFFSCKKSDTDEQKTKPTISTASITNISAAAASGGGFIGDSSTLYRIIGRGVVYSSTQTEPSLNTPSTIQTYDHLNTTNSWGNFPSNLITLTSNTTYYVRAYVYYEKLGTGQSNSTSILGEIRSFKTLP